MYGAILGTNCRRKIVKLKQGESLRSRIDHYSHNSTTDMICFDMNNSKVLVEIEYKLSNLFKHEHQYETFDYVICWCFDLDINEKKMLKDGIILGLTKENEEWILKYGAEKIIYVIELRSLINIIKNK